VHSPSGTASTRAQPAPTKRRADEQAEWSTADREAPLAVAREASEKASATISTRADAAPITCRTPQPAAVIRLVCFAHSGGGPAAFRSWPTGLAPDVEVWTAALPGRGTRSPEPFARDWAALRDEFAAVILEQVPPPLAIFGHSLGAAIGFEVTRALTRLGAAPAHLVVSARRPPDIGDRFALPADDDGLLNTIGVRYGGIPDEVLATPELLGYFLPILRADLELATSYVFRPGPVLTTPITALTGDADRTVSPEQLAGWRRHTLGDCAVRQFPGGHFYLKDHEQAVLRVIHRRLLGLPGTHSDSKGRSC
jgi:medium-chain acyl-[acyl-carrier-protein] hydrolase